jgi:hypothetical protein
LIPFWQGEVDYPNNSAYIFKEERKHSLGARAFKCFLYQMSAFFNGSSYLENENEIKSRPHFPIEQMCLSHDTNGNITSLSSTA